MSSLLTRLLTDTIEKITDYHKRVILEEQFLDELAPIIDAIQMEIKREKENIIQVS